MAAGVLNPDGSNAGLLAALQGYVPAGGPAGGVLAQSVSPSPIDSSQFTMPQLPQQPGGLLSSAPSLSLPPLDPSQFAMPSLLRANAQGPSMTVPALDPSQFSLPKLPSPTSDAPHDFLGTPNPDGTTSYLGGVFKYDPTKDVGGSRLGLFGAALQDISAHLDGRPEAATNLKDFAVTAKKQEGQKLLSDVLGGIGGGNSQPGGLSSGAQLSQNLPPNLPRLSTPAAQGQAPPSGLPSLPGTSATLPQLPQSPPFSMQALAPKLAALAARGVDINPILTILKDTQTKYSQTPQYTQTGAPYVMGEDGTVKWLDPSLTPRDKMEIAGNGKAYDPYTTQAGADFSDRSKPFDSVTGAGNAPVQRFEMNKVTAPAQIRANVDLAKMGQDNYAPPTTIGFTGPNGEEQQVAAVWDKRHTQYINAGTGQPIVNPQNLRVVGNATGGARSQAAVSRVLTSAEDATSGIENLSGINAKGSGGLFPNLETTPLSALGRTVTSQEVQDVQATMAGLGRAMGGLATGGLAVDQNTQKSYEGLGLNTGDTQLTKMRKLAELRQQSTNALDVQAVSPILTNDQKAKAAALSARIKAAVPWSVSDVQALENSQNPNISMRDLATQKLKQSGGTSGGVKWKVVAP